MRSLIAQELFKLRSTPAAWVAMVTTVVLGLASVAANALLVQPGGPAFGTEDHANKALSVAALTSMVMLTLGILSVAGEYRHRTILQTYLGEPRRGRVLLAKLATVTTLGAALGAVTFGMAYAVARGIYAAKGFSELPVDVAQLWLGATLSSAAFGLFGVALGALTRSTVAAVLIAIGWTMVVEISILQAVAPEIGKWLPAGAGVAVTTVGSAGLHLLPPATAAVLLVGWAVALAAAATRFTIGREAH